MLKLCTIIKTPAQFCLSQFALIGVLFLASNSQAATIIAASVLPVSDYTRITIESNQAMTYNTLTLKNPSRIVLDLKNASDLNKMKELSKKILPSDVAIKQIRVGKFQQNITRIVIDLRAKATFKATQFAPASGYQYRLTLDVIPPQSALASDDNKALQASEQSVQEEDNGAKIILNQAPVFEDDMDNEPDITPNP